MFFMISKTTLESSYNDCWVFSSDFRNVKFYTLFFKSRFILDIYWKYMFNWNYTNSLVNANLFCTNFTSTTFQKVYHSSCNTDTGPSSMGVPGVPWHTQILAEQLTLFQPGGTNYAHLITTGTPGFSDLPTALGHTMKFMLNENMKSSC